MPYQTVIDALHELNRWLGDSPYTKRIDGLIEELENPSMTDFRRQKIRHDLSTEFLFHPKCLGDVYVKDFPGGAWAWWSYLSKTAALCQKELS